MADDFSTSFSQYGKFFQEKLVQALLVDRQFAEQLLEVFDSKYFDVKYLSFLAERYFDYAKKYKIFPTLQLLVTIIRDELKVGTDVVLRDQIIDYLQRMRSNPDTGDLKYVKEKSLEYCRKQALKQALTDAVDQMQVGKYEQIVESIKKAVCVGTTPALGYDFFEDIDARFEKLQRNCIRTGLEPIDRKEILNGGLGAGELGVIIGSIGAGKSHFLIMLGAEAMKQGINVLHYTLELSETYVGIRYDSYLCDIEASDVIDNKEKVKETYKKMPDLGRLKIKEFPASFATIYTLRSHIERLSLRGFRPGLIIVDYADIMRSTRQYDSLRHELKLIYEELRGLALEMKIPIWTASQSNREGSNNDIIDLEHMSEAHGKGMTADFVASVSRKSCEKSTGKGRLYVAKNRFGRDGLVYPVEIDTAHSRFKIVGDASGFQQASSEDEASMKKALRDKWKELKGEFASQKECDSSETTR